VTIFDRPFLLTTILFSAFAVGTIADVPAAHASASCEQDKCQQFACIDNTTVNSGCDMVSGSFGCKTYQCEPE